MGDVVSSLAAAEPVWQVAWVTSGESRGSAGSGIPAVSKACVLVARKRLLARRRARDGACPGASGEVGNQRTRPARRPLESKMRNLC